MRLGDYRARADHDHFPEGRPQPCQHPAPNLRSRAACTPTGPGGTRAHSGGSCIQLPGVLLTVRHNTVHQPGRTVPVMSVRAALTQGRSALRVLTADTALLPGCPAAV